MMTALVIEDNEDNKELITFILEQSGYRTLWAQTGYQGVEYALKSPPDFIILDIQLPDIDGMEVLTKIRSSISTKCVPVIAMTSYAMAGDREKLLAAGCDGYIEKPIEPDKVIFQIKEVIEE